MCARGGVGGWHREDASLSPPKQMVAVQLSCHLLRTVAIRRQVGMRFEVTDFGTSYKVKMWEERKSAGSRPDTQVSCSYVLVPMI